MSEAFVAAARPEGAGRGGAGHLVSGTASHAASNIIIRSHEGGHPLMLSIQRHAESLVRWNHQIFKALKVRRPRHSSPPARVLETTGGVDLDTATPCGGCWVLSVANAAICCAAEAQKTNSSGHNRWSGWPMEIYSGTVTRHADTSRVTQPRLVLVTTSKHCDMQTAVALHGYKC